MLTFASVGNIEARVFGSPEPMSFFVPRGILGVTARIPAVTRHRWPLSNVMVLFSDGVRWTDFPHLAKASPTVAAQELLQAFARETDDATVVVIKSAGDPRGIAASAKATSADCQERCQTA
jgi:hypothetical protein